VRQPQPIQEGLGGRKDDADKTRWDLVPWGPMSEVAEVLTHGARRYGDDNWAMVDRPFDRYFAASMRHLVAWQASREANMPPEPDPESGKSHLAHAICCLLFMLDFEQGDR
jgi:hypothetical protein